MKLQDGMVVKRKDNGLKGVAHKLQGGMWKVKYHDGTHTYTTESAFKNNFVIPELEVNFEDSKCDGVEPIQIMKANMTKEEYRGFLEGNILKYPLRYKHKNGLEDLKKAKTYLTWLIEDIEERGL